YSPNDCSVGDVDGDGRYEIFVKWDPSNSHDNSEGGYTGNVYIDCYTLEGEKLWRIDLGQNIRAGAHYTQFMVYDFDGDGRAEMVCKTAPGTKDGDGKYVIMGNDDPTKSYVSDNSGTRRGQVISGPEYLTIFNGATGAEIHTVAYEPARSVRTSDQWGDAYGGRSERYLACVAYLDGIHPSVVMCRGYYTAAYLCAWDFDGSKLTKRWLHKSETAGAGAYGEGAHSLTVGDVDGDGCDEIVYGSACIDHDGSLLYRTGAGHGDALHLGDFDPSRPGLEVFMVHEEKKKKYDAEFRDARTGKIIWKIDNSTNDIGRGLIADLSDRYDGHEIWPQKYHKSSSDEGSNAIFDTKGNVIANFRPTVNFRIYWDGDLQDELFDGKYDKATGSSAPIIEKVSAGLGGIEKTWAFAKYNAQSCNTTKATPCLQADILGDWREELILWDGSTSSDLLIFTTTESSKYRVPCLMQDHNYRMAIAWQNVGYNQPPHLGYNLADVIDPKARITVTEGNLTQRIETGMPMATIRAQWRVAPRVEARNLPDGIVCDIDNENKTFTISGTPTEAGNYRFTVATRDAASSAAIVIDLTVSAVQPIEPIAHYAFDTAGATTPNSIFGEATVFGSPKATEGIKGHAMQLNGSTDYFVQAAYDNMQLGTADFSIEMWFNSADDAAYLFHKGSMARNADTGASGKWVGIEYKGGDLKFAIDDDATKSEAKCAASDYFDGEWHHLVAVRDRLDGQLKLYIDGEPKAEAKDSTGDISDNNEDIVIGNVNVSLDNYFLGSIDELTVFSGAMSPGTVAKRYSDGKAQSGVAAPEIPAAEGTVRYFDLQGMPVANPGKGLYIRVLNGKATKVLID
ncbi:MAG: Por secretion system protein, partial [Muribaculaceae bacterium]|nr:Por secretion system protein [Muribaculaceae bacterium]